MRSLYSGIANSLLACQPTPELQSRSEAATVPVRASSAVAELEQPATRPAPAADLLNASRPHPPLTPAQELTWQLESPWGKIPVVVWVPSRVPSQRFGMLVTFHGRGETLKGPARGARGWIDDYKLLTARERLSSPPLTASDFQGFVSEGRLREINQRLSVDAYRDIILVMPYLPDVLKKEQAFANREPLTWFFVHQLLPRLRSELPTNDQFGIDGVSLGGRAALLIGLSAASVLESIGALQAALDASELGQWATLAEQALGVHPGLKLRLLTSDEDYYRDVIREFSNQLTQRSVPHELRVVRGTHSYEFNRGPGSYEMLLFHSAALAR
jgi:hypothetical protein